MPTILLCLIGFVLCTERLAEALYGILADEILYMEIMLRHIGVGVAYDALDGLDIHAQSLHLIDTFFLIRFWTHSRQGRTLSLSERESSICCRRPLRCLKAPLGL